MAENEDNIRERKLRLALKDQQHKWQLTLAENNKKIIKYSNMFRPQKKTPTSANWNSICDNEIIVNPFGLNKEI